MNHLCPSQPLIPPSATFGLACLTLVLTAHILPENLIMISKSRFTQRGDSKMFQFGLSFEMPHIKNLHLDESTLAFVTLTGSLYCMHHISNFHSNLVTTLSPNMHLTLKSVPNQNLTCCTTTSHNATSSSSLSSFCSIPFTLGKLKIEMTKKPCIMLVRMGSIQVGRTCIIVMRMGAFLWGEFPWKQYKEAH